MKRNDFVDWLQARLTESDVPVRRWEVDKGLEDLEIQTRSSHSVRLRIVGTPPPGGVAAPDAPPATRPAGTLIERLSL